MMRMIYEMDEYILDRELQYHLNRAIYYFDELYWRLAYDQMLICQGIIYAAASIHMISAEDALTILQILRASEMTTGNFG